MSTTFQTKREIIAELSHTPPYLIARPSVRHVDLKPLWDRRGLHVVLFSDGVDNLVTGRWVFHPSAPSKANPLQVVSSLLDEDEDVAAVLLDELGHGVEPRWSGNRALDVLGNLVGGTDAERLRRVLDVVEDPEMYVDDTSIVVFDVSQIT